MGRLLLVLFAELIVGVGAALWRLVNRGLPALYDVIVSLAHA